MTGGRQSAAIFLLWFSPVALLWFASAGCGPSSLPAGGAPSVTLQIVDAAGYERVLTDHRGRVVLVDCWATWCVPCREQFPRTVELASRHAGRNLSVISLSLDDPKQEPAVRKFLKEQGATFVNLLSQYGGGTREVEAFDIPGGAVPHYKLYDVEGGLAATFTVEPGAEEQFTHEDIERKILELLGPP